MKMRIELCTVVLTLGLLAGCGSGATGPEFIEGGPPVSLNTSYVAEVGGSSTSPVYRLSIRSTFVNVQSTTVYVHQWCDQTVGADTAFYPWVSLLRDSTSTTAIGYQYGGCYLGATAVAAAPARALAPGDSLTSEFTFPAILSHAPTARDSAALTGKMRLQYIVTSEPGVVLSSAQLIPFALRTSPAFAVGLP